MSQQTSKYLRFGAAITLIVLSLAYLAYTGVQESKSYYVTIKELRGMGDKVYQRNLRVAGNVQPGSIHQQGTNADFVLVENGETLHVVYKGSEPPPDTFKDNAQALATACSTPMSSRPSALPSMLRNSNSRARLLNPSRKDTEVRR